MVGYGQIVVLNGAPRSGKSSIVHAMQDRFDDPWMNLGVDVCVRGITPSRYQPGIGLRPGGERPDLEPLLPVFYAALYESVAAHSRLGLNVVVDVGHHDAYSIPLGILPDVAARLDGLPALFVGVRCPVDVIMARRDAQPIGYATTTDEGAIPTVVSDWQRAVHEPGIYDLEVDTSAMSPVECADAIRNHIARGAAPTAFARLAARKH